MSVPLDQPIKLTLLTYSDAAEETLADATTVTIDLLKPDGTTSTADLTSGVVRDSLGTYHYDFTPATAGRFGYHWHTTGTVTTSQDGAFDVDPKYDAGLLDLATVKKHLNIDSTDTDDDDELVRFIARATPIIETLVGPVVQRTVTDEQHMVSGNRIALHERPVVSVTTITEYIGKTSYTVTVAATPNATDTYGATLDAGKGVLTRWASGSPQTWANIVWVTYVAGRSAVPDNIEQATLELIRHMWKQSQAAGTQSYGETDIGMPTPIGVPYAVLEMLGEEARIDGFA